MPIDGLCFDETVLSLDPPFRPRDLRIPGPHVRMVQFGKWPSRRDLDNLADFMRDHPHLLLRVFPLRMPDGLEFLKKFSFVRGVFIDCYGLTDVSGFGYLRDDIEVLGLGQTRTKRIGLEFLARFRNLRELYIEGHTKGIEAINGLSKLEDLTLRSVTLPDLSLLVPLKRLWSLDIKLGGTRNLGLLPRIGRLKYLELWYIRGLRNIDAIGGVRTLQYLFLQSLTNVTRLPDLSGMSNLRRVHLHTMHGLKDLSPLASAPALRELYVWAAKRLTLAGCIPLAKHRRLREARVHTGYASRDREIKALLDRPPAMHIRKEDFAFRR